MSDEEKKAIESFKEENNNDLSRFDDFNSYTQFKVKRDKIIIALIEKQQKGIEELKEKNEYLPNWVNKKYVSKDEIKAKIEEIKEDENFYREHNRMYEFDGKINILCSLLEKE